MLTGKKIVLTGANSGIGLEVLKILVKSDNKILAVDKNISQLSAFDSDKVIPMLCDVSSKEGVDAIFAEAEKVLGKIDIFYANAGFPYFEEYNYANWDRVKQIFDTNVLSPLYTYGKYLEHLNGGDGHYAMTISAIGKMAMPGYTLYSASKFAVQGFQEGIRFELPKNLKLTCLYPVATDTNFFKVANEKDFEKPFPVQSPQYVAKKMVKGLEKGKKTVDPCKMGLLLPFLNIFIWVKKCYWALENKKFVRFKNNSKK